MTSSSAYPSFVTPIVGSGDQAGYEPTVLSSRAIGSGMSGTPSGGSGVASDGGGGGFSAGDASSLAAAGIPLLMSLFGGKSSNTTNAEKAAGDLSNLTKSLDATGNTLGARGADALGPVLSYLTKVAGGDPASVLEATAPERAKVMDQYATAKKSLMFTPRGGGQASATAGIAASEARDLATLAPAARRDAMSQLGTLGTTLTGQGVQAKSSATSAASNAAEIYSRLGTQDDQKSAGLGSSIGKFVGEALPFIFSLF